MKKIISLILTLILLLGVMVISSGCKSGNGEINFPLNPYTDKTETHHLIYTDYFQFQIREEDNMAVFVNLTEEGEKQEILVLPAYVEGYPLTQFGCQIGLFYTRMESDTIKKIYLPYTTSIIYRDEIAVALDLKEIIYTCNGIDILQDADDCMKGSQKNIYSGKYFEKYKEKYNEYPSEEFYYYLANYTFYFNYENSPNDGIYGIDYITETNLHINPEDPIREGYTFGGWFKDSEGNENWDGNMAYSENQTFLYAKWIKN